MKTVQYSSEVLGHAVCMVCEERKEHSSDWSMIVSIVGRIGCSPQTFIVGSGNMSGTQANGDGLTTEEKARMKALEHEVRELKRANEILRLASVFFA